MRVPGVVCTGSFPILHQAHAVISVRECRQCGTECLVNFKAVHPEALSWDVKDSTIRWYEYPEWEREDDTKRLDGSNEWQASCVGLLLPSRLTLCHPCDMPSCSFFPLRRCGSCGDTVDIGKDDNVRCRSLPLQRKNT